MTISDDLNKRVTEAIAHAQGLEGTYPNSQATKEAFARVTALEARLAEREDISAEERDIARRGAIRAAVKAGDPDRAKWLMRQYGDSPEVIADMKREFRELTANS